MTASGVRDGSGDGVFSVGAIATGTIISLSVTFLISIIFSIVVTFSNWTGESSLLPWVSYFSIIVGGFVAAKKSRRIGWLHGIAVAICYFLLSLLLFQGDLTMGEIAYGGGLIRVLTWSVAGLIGGIIGVDS